MVSINLSGIPRNRLLGRLLRIPLRFVPPGMVVRIIQGPARGVRWIVGSSTHGAWLGSYELSKAVLFARELQPNMTIWDVGANVGFYSLLAARRVGAGGSVVAFEPLERNLRYLRRHVALNGLSNVTVVPAAVIREDRGDVLFEEGESASEGRVSPLGTAHVRGLSLDSWWRAEKTSPPDVIKMDIEGGEHEALLGGERVIRSAMPVIFLATHGKDVRERCLRTIRDWGYAVEPIGADPEANDEFIAKSSHSGLN